MTHHFLWLKAPPAWLGFPGMRLMAGIAGMVQTCETPFGGFHKSGYPKMVGLRGKIPSKGIMTGGYPYFRKPPFEDGNILLLFRTLRRTRLCRYWRRLLWVPIACLRWCCRGPTITRFVRWKYGTCRGPKNRAKNGRETSKADVNFLVLGTHLESHLFVDWVCIDCFFSFLGHALGKNVCWQPPARSVPPACTVGQSVGIHEELVF